WEEREQQAYDADIAPGQIISNSSLVDIARHIPRSINQLRRISQLRNRSAAELKKWVTIISTAADSDPKSWPEIPVENHEYPTKQFLKNNHPDLNELVNVLREDRDDLGEDIAVVPDSLVSVAVLRSAVWATRGDIRSPQYGEKAQTVTTTVQLEEFLREHGLRNWQVEQLTPVLESALL
ncbi:MAG: HRDC domain-containing protein, partial [Corynebacterium casei]